MSENDADADIEPEGLVVGQCELTQEGVQWLADFDSRPQGSRTRMVELYIMTHGVPFNLENLLNWLGEQLVTRRNEYLHGPPKSGASYGNQLQSRMKSNIQQNIADIDTEEGSRQSTNPLLVRLSEGRYTLHPNHVESICERNTDYLRPRTEEEETTSESGEEQATNEVEPTLEGTQLPLVEAMQFPPEVLAIQAELDEDRKEDSAQEPPEEDPDQRGWVYVLYSPAYPTWVVTGKGKSRKRPEGYNTYTPHRDFEVVGIAYTPNRKEAEKEFHDEIDKVHPGTRGPPAANGTKSEWFEITREQAYDILESLHPENTHRNVPEEE